MANITPTMRALLVLTLLLTATACREPATPGLSTPEAQPPGTAVVSGTITYRERLALTDRARAEVTLEDVSRQDVAAPVLARQVLTAPGQVPIRFELEFRPADIDQRMAYAVRAKIYDRGRLLFTTDTHTPVLTRGAGREAHLLLVAVEDSAKLGRDAQTDAVGVEFEGMFRYLADAARFRDCSDGRNVPVAMEGAFPELERAYLDSGIEAGKEVLVRIEGRFQERPAMEGNSNEVNLIVDKFENLDSEGTCEAPVSARLRDTYWLLVEVDGQRIATLEGGPEAHLILATEESRVTGHAGCNRFFGSFKVSGDQLGFSALGSTMMACPEGMQSERAFLQALDETNRYAISGQTLTLFADNRALVRLEAGAPR